MKPGVVFEEVQRPPKAFTVSGVVVVGAALVATVWMSARLGQVSWVMLGMCLFALVVVVATRLRTVVTGDRVLLTMPPFLWKGIPLAEVEHCDVTTFRPLRDYGGWGWKWTPWAGTAYSMRGNRGVRVQPKGRRAFVIGSQRPDELAAAIRSARPGPPSGA